MVSISSGGKPAENPVSGRFEWLKPAGLLFAAGVVLFLHISGTFTGGILSNDIHTYWQYARNFLAGMGFVGNTLSTGQLWEIGFGYRPVGTVLHPLVLALCFRGIGDWLLAAVFSTSLLYLACVPAVYYLARRWVGKNAAVAAGLFFVFSPHAVYSTLFGGSDPLFVFLLLAGLLILYPDGGMPRLVFGTLLLGLAVVARPVGPMYVPPLAFWLWLKDSSSSRMWKVVHLTVFLAVIWGVLQLVPLANRFGRCPTPVQTVRGTGQSGALLCHSPLFPGYSAKRLLAMPARPVEFILSDPAAFRGMMEKVLSNLRVIAVNLPHDVAGRPGLFWLALAGIGFALADGRRRPFAVWYLVCLGLQLAVLSLSLYTARYVYPMLPFTLMLAAFGLRRLAGFAPRARTVFAAACCLLLLPLPVGGVKGLCSSPGRASTSIDSYRYFGAFFSSLVPSGENVFSDSGPWLPDVYGGGTRVIGVYPRSIAQFARLVRERCSADTIVMSDFYRKNDPPEWNFLFNTPCAFWGYEPVEYRNGKFRAVLYRRDSAALLERLLSAAAREQAGSAAQLRLLARAFWIDPRSEALLSARTAALRAAADQGAALRQEARAAFDRGEDLGGWRLALKASQSSLPPEGEPAVSGTAAEKLVRAGRLAPVRYTRNYGIHVSLSMNAVPCSGHFTDGQVRPVGGYFADTAQLDFDFGAARFVDSVTVYALRRSAASALSSVSLFVSVDGVDWVFAAEKKLPPRGRNAAEMNRVEFSRLGLATPFVRVQCEGEGFLPVDVEEVEIAGFAEPPVPAGTELSSVRFVDRFDAAKAYRNTGRAQGREVRAGAGDRPGHLVFGREFMLPAGKYRAVFEVSAAAPEGEAFLMDVAADKGRRVLARRAVSAPQGLENAQVALEFSLSRAETVEPRLFFPGRGKVVCRAIRLEGEPEWVTVR